MPGVTRQRAWTIALSLVVTFGAGCASQDPGAFEVVPRNDSLAAPASSSATAPTSTGPASAVFTRPYEPGPANVYALQAIHSGNGGPQSLSAAQTTDCLSCHGENAVATKFLAAGVASEANAEVGVRLANGTLRTAQSGSLPDSIFVVRLEAGDSIEGARVGVRNARRFKDMSSALTKAGSVSNPGACNQAGSCHGGTQGVIFRP